MFILNTWQISNYSCPPREGRCDFFIENFFAHAYVLYHDLTSHKKILLLRLDKFCDVIFTIMEESDCI